MGTTTVSGFQNNKPVLINLDDFVTLAVKEALNKHLPKGRLPKVEGKAMTPLGKGASYTVEGDKLHIVIDIGQDAWRAGWLSNNKRNWMVASSKGNPLITDSPIPGLRIALNLYTPTMPEEVA